MNNDIAIAQKLVQLQQRCRDKNLEFNLTFTSVKNMFRAKRCQYTGELFSSHNRRSIDRIDNSKGYVMGNVVVCSKKLNERKGNLSVEEIESIYKTLKKRGVIKKDGKG